MTMPISKDAEDAVLGSVLLDPGAIEEIEFLEADDFYSEKNRLVWNAMQGIKGNGGIIEMVSVVEALRQQGKASEVDPAYIMGLMEGTPNSAAILQYADIIRGSREKRRLLDLANRVKHEVTSTDTPVDEVITGLEQDLTMLKVSRVKQGDPNYADEALSILDKDSGLYIKTGYPTLDKVIGGLKGFIVIGGRPSMGKSAFLRDLLRAQAHRDKKVALFSQDQPGSDVYRFEASLRSKVPLEKIKNGTANEHEVERWRTVVAGMKRDFKERFAVDDYPYNITQLASRIRAAVRWGATLIGVDYLQLIGVPGGKAVDFQANASHVSKTLKHLAQELRVPIIALAQLNRNVEARANKRPMLSDLRETGQIEQDTDAVMFVFRPSYYERQESGGEEPLEAIAEIIVAKQKDGPTGTVRLKFDTKLVTFRHLV